MIHKENCLYSMIHKGRLMMKLKFDSNLQFQIDAVNAMTEVFYGQPSFL